MIIRGGPAGPDGVGGAYLNEVETDRSAWWYAMGGRQGVLRGFTLAGVAGQMVIDVAKGAALVSERDASGVIQDRGYLVWSDATTSVSFGPASIAARNDALVAAFVDTEDGPVGTGGLDVGPHLVVVPGVSGTTTPRTDSDVTAWLGRGGWVRLADVPIASTDTQINMTTLVERWSSDARLPVFIGTRTSSQSIPNSTITAALLTMQTRIGDLSYDSSTGVVTINRRGVYLVKAAAAFASSASGARLAWIERNSIRVSTRGVANPALDAEVHLGVDLFCEIGDTIRLALFQSSGASLNTGGVFPAPTMSIVCHQFVP